MQRGGDGIGRKDVVNIGIGCGDVKIMSWRNDAVSLHRYMYICAVCNYAIEFNTSG